LAFWGEWPDLFYETQEFGPEAITESKFALIIKFCKSVRIELDDRIPRVG
jgi:hypothetical protein